MKVLIRFMNQVLRIYSRSSHALRAENIKPLLMNLGFMDFLNIGRTAQRWVG